MISLDQKIKIKIKRRLFFLIGNPTKNLGYKGDLYCPKSYKEDTHTHNHIDQHPHACTHAHRSVWGAGSGEGQAQWLGKA